MPDLFKQIIPSILKVKANVLKTADDEKSYVPFVVNKALSFHSDCVLFANEMNVNCHLDKKLQYDFLLNTTRSWNRPFQKWMKLEKPDDLSAVKFAYGCSDKKARDILEILSKDQKIELRQQMDTGGFNNNGKQNQSRQRRDGHKESG